MGDRLLEVNFQTSEKFVKTLYDYSSYLKVPIEDVFAMAMGALSVFIEADKEGIDITITPEQK